MTAPDPAAIPGSLIPFKGDLTQEQAGQFRRDWEAWRRRQILDAVLVAGFAVQLELSDDIAAEATGGES